MPAIAREAFVREKACSCDIDVADICTMSPRVYWQSIWLEHEHGHVVDGIALILENVCPIDFGGNPNRIECR